MKKRKDLCPSLFLLIKAESEAGRKAKKKREKGRSSIDHLLRGVA